MPQVIEWRGAGPDDIVWRYPVEEITNAAQLVVHEYETAVFINERVIDEMSKYDLQTAFTQLDKASVTVKVNINDALKRIGTDLVDFKFEGIDTSDQFRDRLFWIKQKAATSDVLRMETAKDIGSSIGSSPGAGFGAGM